MYSVCVPLSGCRSEYVSCLLCVSDIGMLEYTSKDSLFISNIQRKGLEFSSSAIFFICRSHFFFVAFINAEWLTPYEREPPACSSPAVESIGGILREGGACCLLHLFIILPCRCLSIYVGYRYIYVAYNLRQEYHR